MEREQRTEKDLRAQFFRATFLMLVLALSSGALAGAENFSFENDSDFFENLTNFSLFEIKFDNESGVNDTLEVNESFEISIQPIFDEKFDGNQSPLFEEAVIENESKDSAAELGYRLKNKFGDEIGTVVTFDSAGTTTLEAVVEKGGEIASISSVVEDRILIGGLRGVESLDIVIDSHEGNVLEGVLNTKVVAVSDVEIDSAILRLAKSGNVNAILWCADFNVEDFFCENWEVADVDFVDLGDYIEFSVEHFSAYVGAEIVAVDAIHYDGEGNFVANIFDDVKTRDSIWSQKIFAGESVKVTFEKVLTNGRIIDVYVRSQGTFAYFDIYAAGTDNWVGRSGITNNPELQYIIVENLTEPTDTFDFRVKKVFLEEEDNSTLIDPDVVSFLEFDYIHDDVLTSTHANGLLVYNELNLDTPRYRTWNDSMDFSPELTDALDVGGDVVWTTLAACHEREEAALAIVDRNRDVNIQIRNSSGSWSNLLEVSTNVDNAAYRGVDIEYEEVSGDLLIVYETSNAANSNISYRIWNGSGYSDEQTYDTGFTDTARFIELVPLQGSDTIMMIALSEENEVYAVPWNGSTFESSKGLMLSTAVTSAGEQHYAFAWEQNSGAGLVFYGEGNDAVYRTYSPTEPHWSTEATIALGHGLDATRLCSDYNSDYIGIVWQDSGNDVNVRMWDGTSILASPPTEDTATEPAGGQNANMDCAWHASGDQALFGFVDNNGLVLDYLTFTKSGNSWSTSTLTTTSTSPTISSDDARSVRFVAHPTLDQIMVLSAGLLEDIYTNLWNGTGFVTIASSPVESSSEVSNGAQEGQDFVWDVFDPAPNVSNFYPSSVSYNIGATVQMNVTVKDNMNISSVSVNVTQPNGSILNVAMTNSGSNDLFSANFTATTLGGTYTTRVIANDSSRHLNVNASVVSNFSVSDIQAPDLDNFVPANGSSFDVGSFIELAANVSDVSGIDLVVANVTYSNGSKAQLNLTLGSGNKYNTTLGNRLIIGLNNVTFRATDLTGNANNSGPIFITVTDTSNPNVYSTQPEVNSSFNVSENIEIAVNVTDDSKAYVLANVTFPNGTINQLLLVNSEGDKFNTSFSIPLLIGTYSVHYLANDSGNNLNYSVTTNFTALDLDFPDVYPIAPAAGSNYLQNSNFSILVNVTDIVGISAVLANITVPNGTIVQQTFTDVDLDNVYNLTYFDTNATGVYTIRFLANDTADNENNSATLTFTIQDAGSPLVNLLTPSDLGFIASNAVSFSCNATDASLANITLYHNISGTFEANQTQQISGTSNQSNFNVSNVEEGVYLWSCLAVDTGSASSFASTNYTFTVDTTSPLVTLHIPVVGSEFNTSNKIIINATVTDNYEVDTVLVNITYPNSSIEQKVMNNYLGNNYNASITAPDLLGTYNITILANDSGNTVNFSVKSSFTVNDVNDINISVLGCSPQNLNLSQAVVCNSTASDNIGISTVVANLTLPNGSIESQIVTNVSTVFSFNHTVALAGRYNVTWFVNDTSGNSNTDTTYFNVSDVGVPLVTLDSPTHNLNVSSSSLTFNFSATDNYDSNFNCSLHLDSVVNATNLTVNNGTLTHFTVTNIGEGSHSWFVECQDDGENRNTSSTRNFIADYSAPTFVSIQTDPSTTDELDPRANVTVKVNISEPYTVVQTVILQYKLSSNATYSNKTMSYNSASSLYESSFVPIAEGVYQIRAFANDTLDNAAFSNIVNVTVENDTTWIASPDPFTPVVASLNANVSIGTLLINNTGDSVLSFNITSTSNATVYNASVNFTLAAGALKYIEVNDTASEYGVKTVSLNVTADPDGSPRSDIISANVVVADGQPVLSTTILAPSGNSVTVTQGDTNVVFSGRLTNIGDGNASNLSLYLVAPSEWEVTFGELNETFGELNSQDTEEITIEFTIPENATEGTYTVELNASGFNQSGVDLRSENLVFGDTISVVVENSSDLGTSSSSSSSSSSSGSSSSSSSSSGGSQGGGSGGGGISLGSYIDKVLAGDELISSEATFELLKGETESFPITVTNIFEKTTLENVELRVDGYFAQFLVVTPDKIDSLEYEENASFEVSITSEEYMLDGTYELTVIISGDLVGKRTNRSLVEKRSVTLVIHSVSNERAQELLDLAADDISSMIEQGFPVVKLTELLNNAQFLFENGDYAGVDELTTRINQIKNEAFEAAGIIDDIKLKIRVGNSITGAFIGISKEYSETESILNLARAAFEREDFATALQRAREAELTLAAEASEFRLLFFAIDYAWLIMLLGMIGSIVGVFSYGIYRRQNISKNIRGLDDQEAEIRKLMSDAQSKYFVDKKLGQGEYKKNMELYNKRINYIQKKRSKLRHKRVRMLRPEQIGKDLNKEREAVKSRIKGLQQNYFVDAKIGKFEYEGEVKAYRQRLAEIEKEFIGLEIRKKPKK